MSQRKFILFDKVDSIALSTFNVTDFYSYYGGMFNIHSDYVGSSLTFSQDMASTGAGSLYYTPGAATGSELSTNGTLTLPLLPNPLGWDNNDAAANSGASFGLGDFDTNFDSSNNGRLKMRTYTDGTTAPYVYQNITIPSSGNIGFKVVLNWSGASNHDGSVAYASNVLGGTPLPSSAYPAVSIAGVTKVVDRLPVSGTPVDNSNNNRTLYFNPSDFQGLNLNNGDTVELRIQMREDISGTNPLELEFTFDSISVLQTEAGNYHLECFQNYETRYSYWRFEGPGLTQDKVYEDFITIMDAYSESGKNASKTSSYIKISDLKLNSSTVRATPYQSR